MSFEEKYKKETDALVFSSECEERFLKAMKNADTQKSTVTFKSRKKIIRLLAAIIFVILILSVGSVAEPSLHSPGATTAQFQESVTDFEDRWKKGKKLPYERGDEEYAFTVLGIASGEFINSCEGFSADVSREYFVTAVRGCNGNDLTLKNGSFHIKITPLIYGREPWVTNSSTLCEDIRTTEKSGVIYYLFDTSFLENFAGRTICFAAYEGSIPSSEIFTIEESGIIGFNEHYKSFGSIIEMPLDLFDTHPETAEKMLLNDELADLI